MAKPQLLRHFVTCACQSIKKDTGRFGRSSGRIFWQISFNKIISCIKIIKFTQLRPIISITGATTSATITAVSTGTSISTPFAAHTTCYRLAITII